MPSFPASSRKSNCLPQFSSEFLPGPHQEQSVPIDQAVLDACLEHRGENLFLSKTDFFPKGSTLEERFKSLHSYFEAREKAHLYPLYRILQDGVGPHVISSDHRGNGAVSCINFGSQDYLGLAADPRLKVAALEALEEFGPHSGSSPALSGRNYSSSELEQKIARKLKKEACLLFPTGWAAGFGAIKTVVREYDTVLIDELAHNCLSEGAQAATRLLRKFRHNDLGHLEELLREAQTKRSYGSAVFVVAESLYSMDADSPDLLALVRLVKDYSAMLILDVAHDFGAMGSQTGTGLLETLDDELQPDLILGSFSKSFASNGGFIACSTACKTYFNSFCSSYIFSSALSPLQTAVVDAAFDIIFSGEGDILRSQLLSNSLELRHSMLEKGFVVGGITSPLVPVFVGEEIRARFTAELCRRRGLLASLVEFPAVGKGTARFRFQCMASHTSQDVREAAEILETAFAEVCRHLSRDL